MIDCQKLIDFCFEFLEGTLPEGERARFQEHLELCPPCVTFFQTYRKTPELSREALATEMPTSVRESIRSFLRSKCC